MVHIIRQRRYYHKMIKWCIQSLTYEKLKKSRNLHLLTNYKWVINKSHFRLWCPTLSLSVSNFMLHPLTLPPSPSQRLCLRIPAFEKRMFWAGNVCQNEVLARSQAAVPQRREEPKQGVSLCSSQNHRQLCSSQNLNHQPLPSPPLVALAPLKWDLKTDKMWDMINVASTKGWLVC